VVVVKKPVLIELLVNSAQQVNTPMEVNANSALSTLFPLKLVHVNVLLVELDLKRMQLKQDVKAVSLVIIQVMMDLAWLAPLVLSLLLQELPLVVNVDAVDNPLAIEPTVSYVLLVNSLLNLEHVKHVKRMNIPPIPVLVCAAPVELALKRIKITLLV